MMKVSALTTGVNRALHSLVGMGLGDQSDVFCETRRNIALTRIWHMSMHRLR